MHVRSINAIPLKLTSWANPKPYNPKPYIKDFLVGRDCKLSVHASPRLQMPTICINYREIVSGSRIHSAFKSMNLLCGASAPPPHLAL